MEYESRKTEKELLEHIYFDILAKEDDEGELFYTDEKALIEIFNIVNKRENQIHFQHFIIDGIWHLANASDAIDPNRGETCSNQVATSVIAILIAGYLGLD